MKIVYLILVHKNANQVNRMISRLKGATTYFILHIDAKCDVQDYLKATENNDANISFVKNRVSCVWGTFSIVEATINGLKFALSTIKDADRVVLLSGQDYPIKSSGYIDAYFRENPDVIFMNYFTLPYKNWSMGGLFRFPNYDKINEIIKIHGGSQWWSTPMYVVKKMLIILKTYPVFTEYFSKVIIPDESFFQTLIFNSDEPFVENVIDDNLKFTFWDLPDINRSVLNINDFKTLKKSKSLFARKFDENIDPEILDKIDVDILKNEIQDWK